MISSVQWVPRGAARRVPVRHELSLDELAHLRVRADEEKEAAGLDDSEEESENDDEQALMGDPAFASLRDVKLPKIKAETSKDEAAMDSEDDEDGDEEDEVDLMDVPGTGAEGDEDEEDNEEEEDANAQAADAFILVGNTDDDFSSLEVHCYNTADGSLYVHHDIALPTFPLSLAWMDYAGDSVSGSLSTVSKAGGTYVGSFVAVGGFDPSIEIWNLDVLDPLEPTLVLKGNKQEKKSKKKGKTSGDTAVSGPSNSSKANSGHNDAVMGLAWNREHRHMLASASADKTIKIWDLDGGGKVLHTYTHHVDKVQSVAWNPSESSVFAAVSLDGTASVTDARAADAGRIAKYALHGEPESLAWNVHNPAAFIVACENGILLSYDCRQPGTPLWSTKAHSAACTHVAQSVLAKGLMATSSLDKSVRLWDINSGTPVHISGKSMGIGQVFAVNFFPDKPFLLAAGGNKGIVAVWDVSEDGGDLTEASIVTGGKATSANVGEDASLVAKRFDSSIVDPRNVAGQGIRPRADGQPLT